MQIVAQYQINSGKRVQVRLFDDRTLYRVATQQDMRLCTDDWEMYKPDGWRDCTVTYATSLSKAFIELMGHVASEIPFIKQDIEAQHLHWRC